MTAITRTYRTRIAAPVHELDGWHRRLGAFERLTPNWAGAEILESEGTVLPGDWKLLKIRALGPAGFQWKLVHQPGVRHRVVAGERVFHAALHVLARFPGREPLKVHVVLERQPGDGGNEPHGRPREKGRER